LGDNITRDPIVFSVVTDFDTHGLKTVVYIFERNNSPNYSTFLLTLPQQ